MGVNKVEEGARLLPSLVRGDNEFIQSLQGWISFFGFTQGRHPPILGNEEKKSWCFGCGTLPCRDESADRIDA